MQIFQISNIEYTRGIATSLMSSGFSQTLIYLTNKTDIKNKDLLLYLITFFVANIISYSFDILLAKDNFGGVRISIYDTKARLTYLIKHLFGYQIIKFFMIVCIDIIMVNTIFRKCRDFLDEKEIFFKNRDQILMFLITTLTFVIYGNLLRFEWVYKEKTPFTLDVLIMAWLSIIFLLNIRTEIT
jgi:hypothetical protein